MRRRHPLIIAILSLCTVALLLAVILPFVPSELVVAGADDDGGTFQISEGLPAADPLVHVVLVPHGWVEYRHGHQQDIPRTVPIVKTASPRSPPLLA